MLYSSNIDVARDETGKDARFDHVPASRACRFLPNFYGKEYNDFSRGSFLSRFPLPIESGSIGYLEKNGRE